ncbi:MAG: winged helix-turn-helix domain-containing protein [Methylibium sp.]
MNAWSAWTRAIRAGLACCALLPGLSPAQGIESVLQPGPVIQGHAKWEHECATCHVKFNRKAQDGQCMDCHKDIGQDVRGKTGYHGRLKPQACNSCHTDHKGRGAQIVEFDPKRFDHRQSDYLLRGAHEKTACDKCHLTAREWAFVEALALRAGRLVSKGDLEALVLGLEGEVSSNMLEVHVSGIRRKLGRGLIETVRGMGYRISA